MTKNMYHTWYRARLKPALQALISDKLQTLTVCGGRKSDCVLQLLYSDPLMCAKQIRCDIYLKSAENQEMLPQIMSECNLYYRVQSSHFRSVDIINFPLFADFSKYLVHWELYV